MTALIAGVAAFPSVPLPKHPDPLFGLIYDPNIVTFEPAPLSLETRCPELANARWGRRMWIYGQANDGDVQFFIIGGFYVPKAGGGHAPMKADPQGALVKVDHASCSLLGPASEVFAYPVDGISKDQLQELAKDAICRYTRAFGTKAKFEAALHRQNIHLIGVHFQVLSNAIGNAPDTCPAPR